MHEIVVMNRLEQLRKRQRDEALQAQQDLLEGVSRRAAPAPHTTTTTAAGDDEDMEDGTAAGVVELLEVYERSMSPERVMFGGLGHEERGVEVVDEDVDRAALVRFISPSSYPLCWLTFEHRITSSPNGAQ